MTLHIRPAAMEDLRRCAAIEAACFPSDQGADAETIARRIEAYGEHVLVGEMEDEVVGYVMGPVIDKPYIEDWMYTNISCHQPDNPYQSVFSLAVMPTVQRRGLGSQLLHAMVALARQERRSGITLTCLKDKISFYEGLDFVNRGLSSSTHGGVSWYNMFRAL